jgi:hypothetical protein
LGDLDRDPEEAFFPTNSPPTRIPEIKKELARRVHKTQSGNGLPKFIPPIPVAKLVVRAKAPATATLKRTEFLN